MRLKFPLRLAALLFLASASVHGETILESDFNSTGSSAKATGRIKNLMLRTADGAQADLHSPDGTGVSGHPGDRALSIPESGGGRAVGARQTLSAAAFTVCGWLKPDPAAASKRRTLCVFQENSRTGFQISVTPTGALELSVNGKKAVSDSITGAAGDWVFFAATYDSAAEGGRVDFHAGKRDLGIGPAGSAALAGGELQVEQAPFVLGNTGSGQSPFFGLIDSFRFVTEALGTAELEPLRAAALPQ